MVQLFLKVFISILIIPIFYPIVIPHVLFLLIANEFLRFIVSVALKLRKGEKIKLCNTGRDGIWEYRQPGNTRMVIVSALTKRGQLDNLSNCIEHLEKRIFSSSDYDKLKHIVTKCYGYVCWKLDSNFAVKNHIRFLNPENPDKEYNEQDHMNLLSELSNDMDNDSKPQWEMIILRNYLDSNNEEKSCFIFRFHHAYMDGMSLLMFFKRLGDNFTYTIDPLNFQIPLWKKCLYYSTFIFFGPYMTLEMYFSQFFTHWKHISKYPGGKKMYQSTKVIELEKLKAIKANTKASIPNIVCLAFTQACKNVLGAERLVSQLRVTDLMAFLPYPDSKPQNRFSLFSYKLSAINDGTNLSQQLRKIHSDSMESILGPSALIYYYNMTIAGRLPYLVFPLIKYFVACESFILSNVPAPKNHFRFMDADCEELGAFPPVPTTTGIILSSISYKEGIKICGQIDSSCISGQECHDIFKQIPIVINKMLENSAPDLIKSQLESRSSFDFNSEMGDNLNNNNVEIVKTPPISRDEDQKTKPKVHKRKRSTKSKRKS